MYRKGLIHMNMCSCSLTSSSPGRHSTRITAWSEKDTLADWLGGLSVPKKTSSFEPFPIT